MEFFGEECGRLVLTDRAQLRRFRNNITNTQISNIISDDKDNFGLVQLFHNLKDPVFQITVSRKYAYIVFADCRY